MGRLDDIIARNKQHRGTTGGGILVDLVRSELNDPTADAADRKQRMLAFAIVGGVILTIVILVAVFA